jgi:methylmalonyl-CoA/ethylmalonyl-CoA epimerase
VIRSDDPTVAFRFHHVGLAVRDIAAATHALGATGLLPSEEWPDAVDASLKVRLRFLRASPDQPLIELVEGLGDGNPVDQLLQKSGPGPYHLCFAVESLDAASSRLRDHKYRPITGRIPAVAFGGALVQFFYHPHCGLVELVELVENANHRPCEQLAHST